MKRLEVSGTVRPLQGSLGVKGLKKGGEKNTFLQSAPKFHNQPCFFGRLPLKSRMSF